jgi:hypothetical protein
MNSSKIDSSKKILSIGLVLLSVIYSSNLEAMIHFENQTGLSNNNLFFIIELPNRKQKKHDFREFINLQELGFPKTLTIKIGTSKNTCDTKKQETATTSMQDIYDVLLSSHVN